MARWTIEVDDGEGGGSNVGGTVWMATGIVGQIIIRLEGKPMGERFCEEKFEQDARVLFDILQSNLPSGTMDNLAVLFRDRR